MKNCLFDIKCQNCKNFENIEFGDFHHNCGSCDKMERQESGCQEANGRCEGCTFFVYISSCYAAEEIVKGIREIKNEKICKIS